MKLKYILMIFIIMIMSNNLKCNEKNDPVQDEYKYYFYESTGANKFILIDGVERKIEFDFDTSVKSELEALLSLKWNVLYPNSKGMITLYGTYDKNRETFSLTHWQLPRPFKAYRDTEFLEPKELETRDILKSTDFNKKINNTNIYHEKYNKI